MNSNPKLSYAITAILSAGAIGFTYAAPATTGDTAAEPEGGIQEITVTAQRRTENAQNVPIQLQALTAETLTQLNVATFDEFVRDLPNVTTSSTGPSQGDIYMRGLASTTGGTAGNGATGSFPNVAVYLDDQSVQLQDRHP